jgi:hypothetical protein
MAVVKIADEAYPDTVVVVFLHAGMRAIQLVYPPAADLDQAVLGPASVSNDKMIPKPVFPTPLFPVKFVKFSGAP